MSYFNLIKLNAITSTNDFLKERYQKGACVDGDLSWAKKQTKGRGQRNRSWISSHENSLTFSVYISYKNFNSKDTFAISAAVAVGLVNALAAIGVPDLKIKWPNDILSCNKKIAGILIENIFKYSNLKASIIGIGLNINQLDFEDLPHAGSLATVTGKQWDLEDVFNVLKEALEKTFFSLKTSSKEQWVLDYSKLLWKRDELALFERNGETFKAISKGVSYEGALLLENMEGKPLVLNSHQLRMLYNFTR
ncbi:MAG: BirA family biotin operon repressor/biotin-[acetyl-CoA-carboxylase] ligase [Flavobacteriaceae bacterium]|jgi:BirA family biotin operon repressor/biotin-[acetyl-CoA-carboxylase] ligase|tara:strand:- start:6936 stop:7685 length:750 start_codon:yes stop_codon:yes gene_type:complete